MDNLEVRDLIRPLLKWWWLISATILVALVSYYMYIRSQPVVYQAQTTIMVGMDLIQDPNPSTVQLGITEQLARAYADIALRAPLRHATMVALGLDHLPPYTVVPVSGAPLIEITVTDGNPQVAQAVARELVNQLILQSPVGQEEQERQSFIGEQLAKLEQGIRETEEEIERRQDELTELFSAREIADTQGQITALQAKLTSLRGNYSALLSSSNQNAINQITVLEPAALPRQPIAQDSMRYLLIAVVVGFVLGAGGAYLLELLDDTIKSPAEVYSQLGVTMLASIPTLKADSKLIMLNGKSSDIAEAYRGLRSNVQHISPKGTSYMLLMTGPAPHEGKSISCANLGIALAHAGKQVILIDADLHRPVQHRLFDVPNTVGLSTVLTSCTVDLKSVVRATTVPDLFLLPSGPLPPNPAELLGSERMEILLSELGAYADVVIIDSPPVTAVVDATTLSKFVDGVVMVLRANRTRRNLAKRALETLRQVDAPVVGAILTNVASNSSAYNHSAYGYRINAISNAYPSAADSSRVNHYGTVSYRKRSNLSPNPTSDGFEE
jgi:non-specific protein-tyrosine kinase